VVAGSGPARGLSGLPITYNFRLSCYPDGKTFAFGKFRALYRTESAEIAPLDALIVFPIDQNDYLIQGLFLIPQNQPEGTYVVSGCQEVKNVLSSETRCIPIVESSFALSTLLSSSRKKSPDRFHANRGRSKPKSHFMKYMILAFTILSCPSAFAMHAYAVDDCTAAALSGATLTIGLANDRPVSPHRINLPEGSSDRDAQYSVNIDQTKDSLDEPVAKADLVMKVTANVKTASKKLDDGCFQGQAWTSVRVMTVQKVNPKLKEIYGIESGDVLHFSCYSNYQSPTGSQCQ
jgi:hypothetical protein